MVNCDYKSCLVCIYLFCYQQHQLQQQQADEIRASSQMNFTSLLYTVHRRVQCFYIKWNMRILLRMVWCLICKKTAVACVGVCHQISKHGEFVHYFNVTSRWRFFETSKTYDFIYKQTKKKNIFLLVGPLGTGVVLMKNKLPTIFGRFYKK